MQRIGTCSIQWGITLLFCLDLCSLSVVRQLEFECGCWSVEIGKATIVQKDFGSRKSKTSIYFSRCFTAHNVV